MDVVYPDFSMALDKVFLDILVAKLVKCGLGVATVRWISSRLTGHVQSAH